MVGVPLTWVCPHVSLQLVCVSAGVAAKTALEWTLTSVGTDVTLQFAHLYNRHTSTHQIHPLYKKTQENENWCYLHAGVVAHGTFEGFLMCVFVATVTDKLSAGHERHVTICAFVWSSPWINKVAVKNKKHIVL